MFKHMLIFVFIYNCSCLVGYKTKNFQLNFKTVPSNQLTICWFVYHNGYLNYIFTIYLTFLEYHNIFFMHCNDNTIIQCLQIRLYLLLIIHSNTYTNQ